MSLRASTPEDLAWLQARIGALTVTATGITSTNADGTVGGVVAYDWRSAQTVEIHVCLESASAGRALLRAAFAYPFIERDRQYVLAEIPSHRLRAVRLAKRLGFEETSRIPDGWSKGSDLIFFLLPRERCRFLEPLRKAA